MSTYHRPHLDRLAAEWVTHAGETLTVAEWCARRGLTLVIVYHRRRLRGWSWGRTLDQSNRRRRGRTKSPCQEPFPGADIDVERAEFGAAMNRYERRYGVRYPRFDEAFYVAWLLGYRKVAEAVPLPRAAG